MWWVLLGWLEGDDAKWYGKAFFFEQLYFKMNRLDVVNHDVSLKTLFPCFAVVKIF